MPVVKMKQGNMSELFNPELRNDLGGSIARIYSDCCPETVPNPNHHFKHLKLGLVFLAYEPLKRSVCPIKNRSIHLFHVALLSLIIIYNMIQMKYWAHYREICKLIPLVHI